jgi:hypothetical protein
MSTKKETPVIGIKQVLDMLSNGQTREEIRLHYGLNKTELGQLFKHPELKGKKTKKPKAAAFVIVEDETECETVNNIDVVAEEVKGSEPTMEIVADEDEVSNTTMEETEEEVEDEVEEEVEETQEIPKATWH